MTAPSEIESLVEHFSFHVDDYKRGQYNETQVRREFVDPLFHALGWDVTNKKGWAEAYKDVIHEDSINVGGSTKAPDYCFRIGGQRKFFVETKRPSVNLRKDPEPAYQLRRYAWSAKLPLSILTDFEELAVYDCRVRPDKGDKASTGRTMYFKYTQYLDCWDEIAAVFSRDAILKGSFDKYAESKRKRGTAEVDDEFLKEIERWREVLAKNLALRNKELSQRALNFAVQKTIDRIIFLRICEDRGIESINRLRGVTDGAGIYPRLCRLFREADAKYNSGLFHFERERDRAEEPDEWTLDLAIDDKVLKDIIRHLYYPDSPYEFSVLPADILGQVYEQFLGKVIRLTGNHRAIVEEKPEVRKAGGVYYTPTYIVDYIVQNTVGKLVEGHPAYEVAGMTPKWNRTKTLRPLKVLDPACGSGSFLIGAYQFLLDWYLAWYMENEPEAHMEGKEPRIYEAPRIDPDAANYRLTTTEKKRILLDHIYGVDIDPQAVEVTKLSLLLKVLEGETRDTLQRQLFAKERALPDLADNIKCGNSLIGPDFYEQQRFDQFDEEERLRINVFDWQSEFPDIMRGDNPGFDAVIGNPPYVRQEGLRSIKAYLSTHYQTYDSTADLYVYFIERAMALLRANGLHSFIVSSSFLRANFGRPLRDHLPRVGVLREIIDFQGLPVFTAAKDTYVCIPRLEKTARSNEERTRVCKVNSLKELDLQALVPSEGYFITKANLHDDGWILDSPGWIELFRQVTARSVCLGEFVGGRIFFGIKTGLNKAFDVSQDKRADMVSECPPVEDLIHPFVGGQDIRRYVTREKQRFLIAIPDGWTRNAIRAEIGDTANVTERGAWQWLTENYSPLARHLAPFEEAARKRYDQGEYWWELRACDYYDVLDGSKIIYPDITKSPRFVLDSDGTYIRNTGYCLDSRDKCLVGILNSRMFWFLIGRISIPFGTRAGQFRYRLFTQYMERIPLPKCLLTVDEKTHNRGAISTRVDEITSLLKRVETARTTHERTALERQIAATDRQIDQLVYELYGLTDEEIRLVEEST